MHRRIANYRWAVLAFCALASAGAPGARAALLATESLYLNVSPNNASADAPYEDEVFNTSPNLSTWSAKGAIGLEGGSSIYPSGSTYVNNPASTLALKFPVGSIADSLNQTYGAGNWTISDPTITFQYTYYANNAVFGAGAGSFETYWMANNNWSFSNGGSAGTSIGSYTYTAGTDPIYTTDPNTLATWAGGVNSIADLGSTYFDWLSPTANPLLAGATAANPNYTSWTTDKTGANQGLLNDNLATSPNFVNALTSASATGGNPDVSFYFIPNSSTLGICIFTGGGAVTPELSFNVVSVPEPTLTALAGLFGASAILRRRRLS
ncbi:MAG: hypothetical protein ABSB42_04315 [Tepidisphaeraceae bacterium]